MSVIKTYTKAELLSKDTASARMWRLMRKLGECNIRQIYARDPSIAAEKHHINPIVNKLMHIGWVEHRGFMNAPGRGGRLAVFRALEEQDTSKAPKTYKPPVSNRTRVRKRLTQCMKDANQARYSAQARVMAQALHDLEKELREIREAVKEI